MEKTERNKRLFFDLNHPADFHFFKHLFAGLQEKGYAIKIIARDKECLHNLLKSDRIPFISRGFGKTTLVGKYINAILILALVLFHLIRFRPAMTISLSSPYLIIASRFLGIPTLTYDDTDDNPRLLPVIRRSNYILSPASYPHSFSRNHFHIQAFKELAYLHPNQYIMEGTGQGLFIRLTRSDSIHHTPESHVDFSAIIETMNRESQDRPCFLSSEIGIPSSLSEKVKMADVIHIHNDLGKCRAFWGNSATMAAEAAILGIPTIFVASEVFSYIKELETYGLLFHFHPKDMHDSILKLEELLADPEPGVRFQQAREKLLNEKIDMSAFMIWFVENFPESAHHMERDPASHLRFIS